MKNKISIIFSLVFLVFFINSCGLKQPSVSDGPEKPKNVIMIIGDGMGPEQVGLLLTYARQAPDSVIQDKKTGFDKIMEQGGSLGISLTNAYNVLVTDSAASGSQMATGQYSGAEMIGLNFRGDPVETVLEKAIKAGKSTGLVSDTRVTHATPAAFASHQVHRKFENAIAREMLDTGPDVILGGGLKHWIPKEGNTRGSVVRKELEGMTKGSVKIKSKRRDSENLIKDALEKGYALAFNREQMETAQGKLLGLFASSAMPNAIQVSNSLDDPKRSIPTLKEMSAKAIDLLSENDQGFFLMIEAGQIDWAAHANDTGLMLHEMFRLDETLNYVLDWAENRDDTLIIVTADHTTGGFGFSYTGRDLPEAKSLPGKMFQDKEYKPGYNFGDPRVLDKIYSQKLSYGDIFARFDGLPKERQTSENLANLVNRFTAFPITSSQAKRILETEDNPIYSAGHSALGSKQVPKLDNKDEFFVYQRYNNRKILLALEVAGDQFVVWNTGTHTNTPVLVFTKGSPSAMAPFARVLHHTQLGQLTIDVVTGR
ncbi:MAG: alkaline phosphatase [Desulfobacteraceae bacterium 4572_89]|nr:MAG: alkaline phosphatase [Desulfobacteraceae bacterium 4572_89]